MKEFQGKVAVITGAASGIGRVLAERCAQEGMIVVLSDVDDQNLIKAEQDLRTGGATVLAVRADVSRAADVEALARATLDAFGAVHLLCNNAGVAGVGELLRPIWESTLADWEWVMGVNLWGVIHGVRVFVPIMLKQDTDCHILNTASVAGFGSGAMLGIYTLTKHGVVTLSETLYHALAREGAKVKVSVLCPGPVNTPILESTLRRQRELHKNGAAQGLGGEEEDRMQAFLQAQQEGISPDDVAGCTFRAIREEKFYIFTHQGIKQSVRGRMEDILQERNPTIPDA